MPSNVDRGAEQSPVKFPPIPESAKKNMTTTESKEKRNKSVGSQKRKLSRGRNSLVEESIDVSDDPVQEMLSRTIDVVDPEKPLQSTENSGPPPDTTSEPPRLWDKLANVTKAATGLKQYARKPKIMAGPEQTFEMNLDNPTLRSVLPEAPTQINYAPPGLQTKEEKDDSSLPGIAAKGTDSQDGQDQAMSKAKRFRVLARMIKTNLTWAKDLHSKRNDNTAFVVKGNARQGDSETLVFDVTSFRAKHRSYGGLTPRARRILLKHPLDRNREECNVLKDVVERLKCFSKYSRKVKEELARVIFYETFPDGRVIIQQGHCGVSFYFIVSGKAQVKLTETDKSTGQTFSQVLGELSEGSSFGELALMHNIKRTATIVCKGTCELIRVDKPDFETVLRNSYQREWQDRLDAFTWLHYFQDWSETELNQVNNHSRIVEHLPPAVIYSESIAVSDVIGDNLFFIVSGQAILVRLITFIVETLPSGERKLVMPCENEDEAEEKVDLLPVGRRYSVEQRHWHICDLNKGHYFGVGEDMHNQYILASERLECLLVPRVQFMRFGRSRILEKLRRDLMDAIPTNQQAFKKFMSHQKWERYKKDTIKEVLTKKRRIGKEKFRELPNIVTSPSWMVNFEY